MRTEQYLFKDGKWDKAFNTSLDSRNTLILVFMASKVDAEKRNELEKLEMHYPMSRMVGCSTCGEVCGAEVHDDTISISITRFEQGKIQVFHKALEDYKAAKAIGRELAHCANKVGEIKGMFILSEGLKIPGAELASGINAYFENQNVPPVAGGLAGDGARFENTFLIKGSSIVEKPGAIAICFYGDIIFEAGKGSGWSVFGLEKTITKSKKNELFELNDKPILDEYKNYLGDRASELPGVSLLFPIAIRKNREDNDPRVRAVLGVNEENNSLLFAGDVPEGSLAQYLTSGKEDLIGGAFEATKRIKCADKPSLCIITSCVARKHVLDQEVEAEIEEVSYILPEASITGFYSYGELSPHNDGLCELHNHTLTLVNISEAD